MTRFYVKSEAGIRETVGALVVAVGVGAVSFYLARMLLARDDLESKAPPHVVQDPERGQPVGGEGV